MTLKKWATLCLFGLLFSCTASEDERSMDTFAVFESASDTLKGPEDEVAILEVFPSKQYQIYHVEGVGSFYLDNIYDTIKNHLRKGQIWEQHLIELMQKYIKPGTTAVDIGAHIGTHTVTMSKLVGKNGNVIAIEPQMKIFTELMMNLKLNGCSNVIACRCVIGPTFEQIHLDPSPQGNEGGTMIGSGGDPAQMIPLDSFHLKNISFIKIDTENFEEEVLEGAKETIQKNRPYILIEIMGNWNKHVPDREEKTQKVLKKLESMGYAMRLIYDVDWLAIPLKNVQSRDTPASS